MKKNYISPMAEVLEISDQDILTASIILSNNPNGADDGGDFDRLFG